MCSLRLIYIKRITYTVAGLTSIQFLMILNQKFFIFAISLYFPIQQRTNALNHFENIQSVCININY